MDRTRSADFRDHLHWQAQACGKLGSPLYHHFFNLLALEIGTGGALDRLLDPWVGDIAHDLPGLRLAGALHALALSGQAEDLAKLLPSCGGVIDLDRLLSASLNVMERHDVWIANFMTSAPQTNEVQRCAMLVPGFHALSHRHGPTMEILELGASAGLNQNLDRVFIDYGAFKLGPGEASVRLSAAWTGPPARHGTLNIVSRRGCDLYPVDVTKPDGALRLKAYTWPDQTERLARLEAAIALAKAHQPRLDQASAAAWLARRLAEPWLAPLRVVFHSYMWSYLPAAEQKSIEALLADAGSKLDGRHTLAWLRFEEQPQDGRKCHMTLTEWPGSASSGAFFDLAWGSPHGQWIHVLNPMF